MDVNKQIKSIGTDMLEFLAVLGGVALGQAVVALVPKTNNKWADIVLPGAVNLGVAAIASSQFKNEYAALAAKGVGVSGVASLVFKLTEGKGGVAAKINKAAQFQNPLAGLKGLGRTPVNLLTGGTPALGTPVSERTSPSFLTA